MTRKELEQQIEEILDKLIHGQYADNEADDYLARLRILSEAMEQYRTEGLREGLREPIEDGLYSTGRFTQDECGVLTDGLLMYINEYLKQKGSPL